MLPTIGWSKIDLELPFNGYTKAISAWMMGDITVISELVNAPPPDSPDIETLFYHLVVSKYGKIPDKDGISIALHDFDLEHAEFDVNRDGDGSHYWAVVPKSCFHCGGTKDLRTLSENRYKSTIVKEFRLTIERDERFRLPVPLCSECYDFNGRFPRRVEMRKI